MNMKLSVLGSGSSGNAIYVSCGQAQILIDAGMSGREIDSRLKKCASSADKIDAIFLTHEHNDHIKGAGVLSRRCDIPIFANKHTWEGAAKKLGSIKDKNCRLLGKNKEIGKINLKCFSLSHDARDPVGYIVSSGNKKVGVVTDTGYLSQEVKSELQELDFLIIEANHDYEMLMHGPYPAYLKKRINSKQGHLSNDAAAVAVPELVQDNCPRVLLAHLSQDNNIPEIAYITIKNNLEREGLKVGQDIKMGFTYREKPTEVYQI